MTGDIERVRRCVAHFRKLGLVPLPSRSDRKGPALEAYEDYWKNPVPESIYEKWSAKNVQLITGLKSAGEAKIVVVDCDGKDAARKWVAICKRNGHPPMGDWVSRSGSGTGWHIYFRLPEGAAECPSGMIWGLWDSWGQDGKGTWVKHQEIRLLGDRSLVIAPPSIHVDTGRAYTFAKGASPKDRRLPSEAPAWLLAMPRLVAPRCVQAPKPAYVLKSPIRPVDASADRDAVLDSIADKAALARSWRLLELSQEPNAAGWHSCRAIGREDRVASGRFSVNGVYEDRREPGVFHSLFDVGVLLGHFADWQECKAWCAAKFLNPYQQVAAFRANIEGAYTPPPAHCAGTGTPAN